MLLHDKAPTTSGFLFLVLGLVSLEFLRRWEWLRQIVDRSFRPRIDSASPTGILSDREMESIVALGEVLVEGRSFSAAGMSYFIEHVNDQTRNTPGYLSLYSMTANLLDRLAHSRFSALDIRKRTALLVHSRLTSYHVRMREYLLPFHRQVLAVRVLAVPNLIAGYYGSPAGWAIVGYQVFPGRCSNLIRYTRAER